MTLPTAIIAGDTGHIGHHNAIHTALNPVVAPFVLKGIAHGLLADIPLAGTLDRLYFATDKNRIYVDKGSNWSAATGQYAGTWGTRAATVPAPALGDIYVATDLGRLYAWTGSWWEALGGVSEIYPEDYGAVNDGVTDSTTAITNAWLVALARGVPLLLAPGLGYVYNGPGLNGNSIVPSVAGFWSGSIIGAGSAHTNVLLGASSRLVDDGNLIAAISITGLHVQGGLGVFRATRTLQNSAGHHYFEDIYAYGYTSAAIETNASDFPTMLFRNLLLWGANSTSTMGIALGGYCDGVVIEDCEFRTNRVSLKLQAGGNAYVDRCVFYRYNAAEGFPRTDLWVVPSTVLAISGQGFVVTKANKFGNEALDPADYHIVYADEIGGATNGVRWPNFAADSAGYISGHQISGSFIGTGAAAAGSVPCVYSTTPYIQHSTYGDIDINGTPASHILKLRTPAVTVVNTLNGDVIIGPVTSSVLGGYFEAPLATNCPGLVSAYIDPDGVLGLFQAEIPLAAHVPDPVDYLDYAIPSPRTWSLGTLVTRYLVADVYGGIDAAEFAIGTANSYLTAGGSTTLPTVGRTYYLEFDLKAGVNYTAAQSVRVQIGDFSNNIYIDWMFNVPATWKRMRRRFAWKGPAPSGGGWTVQFWTATVGGSVQVGRVRLYAARDPQNVDGKLGVPGKMIHIVQGLPPANLGADNDFAMRSDGTVAGKTTMYHKEAGAWVAIIP